MELGKNATDDLCNSSKWPFWQANVRIHLISVYRGARNSIPYNLVTPFKDGVTFAVTTATQSLQQSYLESVADMTYVAVTNFLGWERGKGLYDLRHKTIVYVLLIFDVWTKRKKKVSM